MVMMHQHRTTNRYLLHVVIVFSILITGAVCVCSAATPQVPMPEPSPPPTTVAATIDVQYWAAHPPAYPVMAMKHHEQGIVVLRVRVSTEGEPVRVVVDKQATYAAESLIHAAVVAAKSWYYNPRTEQGRVVPGWVLVPVVFRLPPCARFRGQAHAHSRPSLSH
jgi:protein TonB